MRTTLTIEEDVAVRLRRLIARRKVSLKTAVNELLRAGLEAVEQPSSEPRKPYRIEPVTLGSRVTELDNVAELLAAYEEEGHR